MLINNTCSAVTSVAVDLKFDDGSTKHRVIANNDLVAIEYNQNGTRRHIEGIVVKVSCIGTDVKNWYVIVDGSDDFESFRGRFCPANILDCEILRKADTVKFIETPIGETGIAGLRIVKGRLQYSPNGFDWLPIRIDYKGINIKDEEGTVPSDRPYHYIEDDDPRPPHRPTTPPPAPPYNDEDVDDDGIKDEVY